MSISVRREISSRHTVNCFCSTHMHVEKQHQMPAHLFADQKPILTKRISKASLLRTSNCFRASVMAVYKVKLIDLVWKEHEFDAPDDSYILDAAADAGVKLPYSCRAGACSLCTGQMVSRNVDQSDGSFLDETRMSKGYLLTCLLSEIRLHHPHTHKEDPSWSSRSPRISIAMATRIAARYVARRFSSRGKVLSEEEKAADNVFIKVPSP